ncbi:nicotinamidase 2 [Lingula anatina]|uniref:Nicotinamidase 2 n=1 Tax=Lingula anatina TaxID=7574 RepID=A0A1S3J1Q0_LINAN|nr:nicotinamidase 2 [Lingula anatina]XP_023931725.1 nicotinamidase 2 [Lingula anatina]XP_023931726.1 nicotinamidase 2 [Lingula anatina]|eukprot:XP_013404350.1 nicotinamidase 2 [Lingula anatina]
MSRRTALLVIDMQGRFKEIAENGKIIENIASLVKLFHNKDLPVVFTQHHDDPKMTSVLSRWWNNPIIKGTEEWQIIPALQKVLNVEDDIMITEKSRYDSFWETPLKSKLQELEVDTVVITGTMTNLCCETTARVAFNNDFNVIFLSDCNATSTKEYHEAALKNLAFGFATVMTHREFLKKYENV